MINNDTLDDLRPTKENEPYFGNSELTNSAQFDIKKSGVKKSFQNMKNILQKAKDGMMGKSIDNAEDMRSL